MRISDKADPYTNALGSVADPWHFCADPDPGIRIRFYFGADQDLDPAPV